MSDLKWKAEEESHGHVFISPAQGTVETPRNYALCSLWMLWELSPEDH